MVIATLIAAGRLDERLLGEALERLSARFVAWIDEGDAADVELDGDMRGALDDLPDVDLIQHSGDRAVGLFVADMDSTMIGQECIDELADYAGLKPQVADITERAMRGELDFRAALAERVALLAGLDEAVLGQCLAERVTPTPGAATLVATLKAMGARCVLVTGGFTAFAGPVGQLLGFDEVHANRLEVIGGKLTGRTVGPIVDGARKAAVLDEVRQRLSLRPEQTVAMGDGANDSAMVKAAGWGIGFKPKPTLAAVADGVLRYHGPEALLWALGIPCSEWIERG